MNNRGLAPKAPLETLTQWPAHRAAAHLLRLAADEIDEAMPFPMGALSRAVIFKGAALVHAGTPEADFREALKQAALPEDLIDLSCAEVRGESYASSDDEPLEIALTAKATLP